MRSLVRFLVAAELLTAGFLAPNSAAQQPGTEFAPPAGALVAGLRESATHRPEPPPVPIPHYSGMMDGVDLWLHVDSEGRVTEVRAGIGATEKQVTAIAPAARAIRYTPFLRSGQPTDAWIQETIQLRSLETIPATRVEFPKFALSKSVSIQLSRSMCYGSCPAYSVSIRGDGLVRYQGDSFVSISGRQTAQIPIAEVAPLLDRFRAANFLALDDNYHASVTDNPYYALTLRLPGKTKSVTDYVGQWVGMPNAVTELEEAVDRTADSARWVTSSPGTVAAMKSAGIAIPSREASEILRTAVGTGDTATVRSLLAAGVEVDPKPAYATSAKSHPYRPRGASLLQVAVQSRDKKARSEMLETLLAIPELKNDQTGKQDALAQAAETGDADLARMLIAAGADPTARFTGRYQDQPSETYLMLAANSGVWAMIDDALSRPHDFQAVDAQGHTALVGLAWTAPQHEDIFPLIDRFLAAGAPRSDLDRVLLDICQPNWIPGLVARGGNPNARDADGNTPLFHSCTVEGIQALLLAGADPSLRNHAGKTAVEAVYTPENGKEDPRAAVIREFLASRPGSQSN